MLLDYSASISGKHKLAGLREFLTFPSCLNDLPLTLPLIVQHHADDKITSDLLKKLQKMITRYLLEGYTFGAHIRILAWPPRGSTLSDDHYISSPCVIDVVAGRETFDQYFDLANNPKRAFYDTRLESLILHHSPGAVTRGPIRPKGDDEGLFDTGDACGRCASSRFGKAHNYCVQMYRDGLLMNGGVCSNCAFSGTLESCSFRRKSIECSSAALLLGLQNFFADFSPR